MTRVKTKQEFEKLRLRQIEKDDRPPMNQEQYDVEFGLPGDGKNGRSIKNQFVTSYLSPCLNWNSFATSCLSFIPILQWLPKYSIRNDLAADIVGGLTTGIMHVPQGIAYSVLAGVDPVYGLYASCFPAFFYMFFGTSRHTSLGSFAVVALMAGVANDRVLAAHPGGILTISPNGTYTETYEATPIQIAATLTFAIGIWQILCGVLRLQWIMTYFSDPLVSGFTTGAAVHVLLAQIDDMMGVVVPKASGPGYVFVRLYDLFIRIPDSNMFAVVISICSIAFLYLGKEFLSPYIKEKFKFKLPIPYELILVSLTAFLSPMFEWDDEYDVIVVGDIPAGLPNPSLPAFSILKDCLVQSIGIAVVTIAIHISMAKMLAKKLNYKIDDNQELYALGLSGVLGGLFPVYPVSTALGRTMVSVNSGTKTQLSTVFSSGLLIAIILWLGPLLRGLPKCVLAAIITIALQPMFKKFADLKVLYPVSKADCLIWVVSFLSTAFIDVMEGLAISLLFAIMSIVFRTQWPSWSYYYPSNEDKKKDSRVTEDEDMALFRFDGPLIFTNTDRFKSKLRRMIAEWKEEETENPSRPSSIPPLPKCILIDCSGIAYVDYMGINAFKEISKELQEQGCLLYIAAANGDVRSVMTSSDFHASVSKDHLFPTVKDAVAIAKRNREAMMLLYNGKLDQISRSSDCGSPPEQRKSPFSNSHDDSTIVRIDQRQL